MTRIFYLVLASLTLTAAAAQWWPRDGISTGLGLGNNAAHAEDRAGAALPVATSFMPPASTSNAPFVAQPRSASSPSAAPATYPDTGLPDTTNLPASELPRAGGENPSSRSFAPPTMTPPTQQLAAPPTQQLSAPPPAASPPSYPTTPRYPPGAAAAPYPNVQTSASVPTGVPLNNQATGVGMPPRGDVVAAISAAPPLPVNGPVAWQPAEQELEGTRVLARVGGEVILAGEVISSVNSFVSRNGHDINAPDVLAARDQLIRMRLQQLIDQRAVLNEARRKIPEEGYKKAMEKFDEDFFKTVVPQMIRDRKAGDLAGLEEILKRDGTTLERQKRDFAETVLFKSWVQQSVKYDQEVTHEQMLEYYQQHVAEFEFPAQCRWEHLSMRFDAFPSKAAAYAALAHAGNEVILGRSWGEVARAMSQGATASQGGVYDWTKKGSLVSKALDEAIFSLPPGTMSPILEDDKGFHIVRVVERREAGRKPFTEAQPYIKQKINDERAEKARKQYIEDVRKKTIIWTAYDDPATAPTFGARPTAKTEKP